VKAQRHATIAHEKYEVALKAKLHALKEMKASHVLSTQAHELMVHHRKEARAARIKMEVALKAMNHAIEHKNIVYAMW